ncbi:hypothetical protein [Candidatus Ferrigenium straubiae]|jgi:hypothetical protein|uniref:hypothetical protein n=1 Tax=Candidatus Ferrigenium straubiae TaxID=2919506 RepID=UPI003F4AEB04
MTHIATDGVSGDSVLAGDISCSIPFFLINSIDARQSAVVVCAVRMLLPGVGAVRRIDRL